MNEAETRAELIDPALKAADWGVVKVSLFAEQNVWRDRQLARHRTGERLQ